MRNHRQTTRKFQCHAYCFQSRGQEPRQSWRPFKSKKFTLEHEGNPDDHYTDAAAPKIKKMKRTSEMEERLLLEPGEQHSWQEISRDLIALGDVLGEGQFGKVYKGTVTDSSGKEMTCAVKMLKSEYIVLQSKSTVVSEVISSEKLFIVR